MTVDEFMASLSGDGPPEGLSVPLRGLWLAAKGEWDAAHRLVQDDPAADSAWVHAHLHRIEGDLENAGYWYGRAGRPVSDAPLEQERNDMADVLLKGSTR